MTDESQLQEFALLYKEGLLQNTLPFWQRHSVDRRYGGFITSLDRDGAIIDTDKGVWQQGRFTWLLGELFNNVEPRDDWLNLALHGERFIRSHGFDPSDGRMWFHLTREGEPIRKRRYAFSESFAAIAYGELAQATGEERFATTAIDLLNRFLSHQADSLSTNPKYTATRPMRGLSFPMIAIVAAQELRDSIQLTNADQLISEQIDVIRRFHVSESHAAVLENVGANGEFLDHFDGRLLNPGHAIEAAWFILREGRYRSDQSLIELGCQMLDWMWDRGWDGEFGGLLYFVDLKGLPVQEYWHEQKFWWPHNEALIASLMAYVATGDVRYWQMHQQVHDWAYRFFPDPEYGEWYGYLSRDGRVSNRAKGNLWKGPFHFPRMQLVCWQLLEELLRESDDQPFREG